MAAKATYSMVAQYEADMEGLKAEVQILKAEAERLAAKTNRYDWFCTFECDYICS